jgi:organic hydroperoxide reductase OsmC/OhrA
MAAYVATISWSRDGATFTDLRYSRAHRWEFDGGVAVPASASPHHVPLPLSDAAAVDPEEAFVAALSSCHMLCFLAIAARRGFVVDRYTDEASGAMGPGEGGRPAITRVVLRPRAAFVGNAPDAATHRAMHHAAHEECYLANSVRTEVQCEPEIA